jgi:probable F420-dependent oxidoreductase
MGSFRVGVQLRPQHCTIGQLREGWRQADDLGLDTIWTWDHFFPLFGEADGPHFEGWSLLAAMACETSSARFGMLVTCNTYRNPQLLTDMARTIDHLSGGRLILGIGSGWFERDYDEYGYEFGTATSRLEALGESLPVIKERLGKLNPPPIGPLPILIGGEGERITLRLVAEHAHMWNGFGPPERFRRKNEVLDRWCEEVGRNPREVERTVTIDEPEELDALDDFLDAGAEHVIVGLDAPFDFTQAKAVLERARGS